MNNIQCYPNTRSQCIQYNVKAITLNHKFIDEVIRRWQLEINNVAPRKTHLTRFYVRRKNMEKRLVEILKKPRKTKIKYIHGYTCVSRKLEFEDE